MLYIVQCFVLVGNYQGYMVIYLDGNSKRKVTNWKTKKLVALVLGGCSSFYYNDHDNAGQNKRCRY